jgi:hypothetical protein
VSPIDIPRRPTEAAARLRSRLAGRRLLIVLDNADHPSVIQAMTPAAAGCAVIVTSRMHYTTVDSDLDIEVHPLPRADATRLLFRHAGRVSNNRAVDRIVELCDFLPLALRLAAARLVDRTALGFDEFAGLLADQRQRLDQLDVQGLAVRSSIHVTYDGLRSSADQEDRARRMRSPGSAYSRCPRSVRPRSHRWSATPIWHTRAGRCRG